MTTELEVQANRMRAALASIRRTDTVMVRPEDQYVIVQAEWSVAGQHLAIRQTYHLSDLTSIGSSDLMLSLRRWADRADSHLAKRATSVIVARARECGMTLGQLLADVGI